MLLLPLLVPDLWVAVQVAVPIAALDQLNLSRGLCKNLSLLSELTLETYGIPRLLHQLRGQHVGIALAAPARSATVLDVVHLGILETLLWVLCLPLLVLQAWVTLQVAVPVAALAHLRNRHLLLHNLLGLISLLLHQDLLSVLRELKQRSSSDEVLRACSALAILARSTAELQVVASRVILVALLLLPLL